MATDTSDEQSLSGGTKEKEPTSLLPADQDRENGEVDKEPQAEDDVYLPSPRKVHGISVRRALFHPLVLNIYLWLF